MKDETARKKASILRGSRTEQRMGRTGKGQVKSQLWQKDAKETAPISSSMNCSFGTTTPTQGVEAL